MNIIIPSYKRSHDLKGKDYFFMAKYCVPESQKYEYIKEVGKDRVITLPDNEDGDILDKHELINFFKHNFLLCEELGCKMWGLSQNEDNRIYKEFLPFNLTNVVLGPFQAHLKHELKFDSRVGTKDDYDMALQQLHKYKKVLRLNKFHYLCEHGDNKGGIVSYRSKEKEIEYCKQIMLKWGKKIIQYRIPPRKMTDLLNAKKVNVPIKGV